MNAVETVRALLAAIEASDWERARSYLADDFTFTGAVPHPFGPDAWLGIHRAFAAAMPDVSFNASGLHEQGGKVVGQVRLTGTQTRPLSLPVPDVPTIQPAGKRLSLPAEQITVTRRGDQIVKLEVSEVEGGGLPGVLAQLGVPVRERA